MNAVQASLASARQDPIRVAVGLVAFTLLYNVAEGIIAVIAGIRADSLVLLAFGGDSYIEVLAAAAVLWRLSLRDEERGERAEQRALRFIGVTFVLLAGAVGVQSVVSLLNGEGAGTSVMGIVLLAASFVGMPALAMAKLWAGARANSPVIVAEAKETFACAFLSLIAFAGLAAMALLGWWWLDAAASLLMVPWLLREGIEGLRGEACFEGLRPCWCRPCVFGLRSCSPACCAPACC